MVKVDFLKTDRERSRSLCGARPLELFVHRSRPLGKLLDLLLIFPQVDDRAVGLVGAPAAQDDLAAEHELEINR